MHPGCYGPVLSHSGRLLDSLTGCRGLSLPPRLVPLGCLSATAPLHQSPALQKLLLNPFPWSPVCNTDVKGGCLEVLTQLRVYYKPKAQTRSVWFVLLVLHTKILFLWARLSPTPLP